MTKLIVISLIVIVLFIVWFKAKQAKKRIDYQRDVHKEGFGDWGDWNDKYDPPGLK